MSTDKKQELLEKRRQSMGGLVSGVGHIEIPEVAPELVPMIEAMAVEIVAEQAGQKQPKDAPKPVRPVGHPPKVGYVQYNVKIKQSNVEYLKNYAFTKSCALKRKYTLTEAINEAILMLEKHTSTEIKIAPEWRK